jgi:predicted ATPase/DNA-binding SARP family transcriptional activator
MACLTLSLLGGFQAAIDGTPVAGFDTDKTRALLAYLAVEAGRPHERETLAGLLWPELPDDAARRNLRNSLFKLRQALGEEDGAPGFLRITLKTVQIDPDAEVVVDAGAFSGLIAACMAHRHRHVERCATCHARLAQAAALYQGGFLTGFHLGDCAAFEEWLVLTRERLHRAAVQALARLAAYHEGRGEVAPALEYTFRQLALEPWREEAHRQAMRLLARSDQRSAALAQYAACRKALAEELNAEPGAETTALYDRLRAGALPDDPAAAPDAPNALHRMPQPLTPFIGREAELRLIIERLDSPDYRLITLIGPGGVGKTRLAWQAAAEQGGAFADGVYWVPLAALTEPDLIPATIGQAVGLRFETAANPAAQLTGFLRDKEMLLVLDNFEQLQSHAATDLLPGILRGAPRVSLLVTSRERLGLQAEVVLDLAGLPLPEATQAAPAALRGSRGQAAVSPALLEPATLLASSAVQLFVERAQQTQPAFALTAETAPGVVEICRLVAGLPLGIVLAAAWVRHFPPARIAAALRANLDFLASRAADLAPQHRSLRAVFDHSWQLLSATEQRVFRGLAVFSGGWDDEAAARVAGATLGALLSLVDKSLVRQDSAGRFQVHEVLRQYAAEKLAAAPGEQAQVRHDHAAYYLELAELAATGLSGETQGEWLARLEREHDNLRAALRWMQEQAQVEPALRRGAALSRFWYIRGYFSEGRATLAAVLALPAGALPQVRAGRARALQAAGDLARAQGDYAAARLLCEESLALYRTLGQQKDIAVALNRLGIVAWNQEDHAFARRLYAESREISRALGDKQYLAVTTGNLGTIAFVEGDYAAAAVLYEESIALLRDLGDKFNLAIRLNNLGNVALMQGDYARARALHREGLALRWELEDKWGIAISLVGLGGAAAGDGDAERGARLLGAAEALLDTLGVTLEVDDALPYEYALAKARAALDPAAFARARAAGRALGLDAAMQDAASA